MLIPCVDFPLGRIYPGRIHILPEVYCTMRIRLLLHGVGAGKSQSLPYNMLQGPAIVVAKAQIWRLAGAGRRYSLSLCRRGSCVEAKFRVIVFKAS